MSETYPSSDRPTVLGIPMLDRQHREIDQAVARLVDAIPCTDDHALHAALDRMRFMLLHHFGSEELLLRAAGHPRLDWHLAEHNACIERLDDYVTKLRIGAAALEMDRTQIGHWLGDFLQRHNRIRDADLRDIAG